MNSGAIAKKGVAVESIEDSIKGGRDLGVVYAARFQNLVKM